MSLLASNLPQTLIACIAMAVACAVLGVFVIMRRWAFIGEGISHAGFGGAGTAWLIALLLPALDTPALPYLAIVVFCLGTGVAIGFFTRTGRVNSDAAIGIFLVASLAWGFLAQQIYFQYRHVTPAGWDNILFGQMRYPSGRYVVMVVIVCTALVATVAALHKEILAYCVDPTLAEVSGVRAGFIHYLLMLLVTVAIIVGVRIVGSVLVTALLVLPGTTATLLSRRLKTVFTLSILVGILGAVGGLSANAHWTFIPIGPAIVLSLFVLFCVAYIGGRMRGEG